MNEEDLLSWEDCRKQIIELGKFEFIEGNWICHAIGVTRSLGKISFLKESCLFHIRDIPETISNQELIYHVLCDKKIYFDVHCLECGKKLKFKCYSVGYKTYCSSNCFNKSEIKKETSKNNYFNNTGYCNPFQNPDCIEKAKLTYFAKTGYTSPSKNPEVISAKRVKYKEKTGYDHPSQNPEVISKTKNTYLKNGYIHPFKSPYCISKAKKTRKDRTGYEHALQNPKSMEKKKKTQKDRTGYEFSGQSPILLEKSKNTYKDKTGFDHPMKNPEVLLLCKQTCLDRYGDENVMHIAEFKEKLKKSRVLSHKSSKVRYSKISQELFWNIFNQIPAYLQNHTHFAEFQGELARYDYQLKTGYFYDFIISSIKLCIEFDGVYFHSSPEIIGRDAQKQNFLEKQKVITLLECVMIITRKIKMVF